MANKNRWKIKKFTTRHISYLNLKERNFVLKNIFRFFSRRFFVFSNHFFQFLKSKLDSLSFQRKKIIRSLDSISPVLFPTRHKVFGFGLRLSFIIFIIFFFFSGFAPIKFLRTSFLAALNNGQTKSTNYYLSNFLSNDGWQHPEKIFGPSELESSSDQKLFDDSNSATAQNDNSILVLGDFLSQDEFTKKNSVTSQQENEANQSNDQTLEEQPSENLSNESTDQQVEEQDISQEQEQLSNNEPLESEDHQQQVQENELEEENQEQPVTNDEISFSQLIKNFFSLINPVRNLSNFWGSSEVLAQTNQIKIFKSAKIKLSLAVKENEQISLSGKHYLIADRINGFFSYLAKNLSNLFKFDPAYTARAEEEVIDGQSLENIPEETTIENTPTIYTEENQESSSPTEAEQEQLVQENPVNEENQLESEPENITDDTTIIEDEPVINEEPVITNSDSSSTPEIIETPPLTEPKLTAKTVFYWSLTASGSDEPVWHQLAEISDLDVNSGYFEYDAPFLTDFSDFNNLKIKVERINPDQTNCTVYLESLWAEANYQEQQEDEEFVLMPLKKDWRADETPTFKVIPADEVASFNEKASEQEQQINAKSNNAIIPTIENIDSDVTSTPAVVSQVESIPSQEILLEMTDQAQIQPEESVLGSLLNSITSIFKPEPDLKVNLTMTEQGGQSLNKDQEFDLDSNSSTTIEISKPEVVRPGKYNIEVDYKKDGKTYHFNQEFTWGVLTINVDKSIYPLTDSYAYIQMASLDDIGHTLCNSNLKLEVTDPNSQITKFTTTDGGIELSGKCEPDNVIDVPDYFTRYFFSQAGIYEMKLTNLDNDYEITDSFEVQPDVSFDVERIGPTRIFPLSTYDIKLKIKANSDFSGEIKESLPAGFIISSVENSNFQIQEQDDHRQLLIWLDINLKAGDKLELKYTFDAPDNSPYVYLLGPLEFYQNELVFKEIRFWQIASDATVTWDGGGTDVTCGAGNANNWSCAQNWSPDGVPLAGDTVVFNGTSTKNATIDSGFAGTATNLTISSGYTGVITQARSLVISTNYSQADGTYTGGAYDIDINGSFIISGGNFTAPSTTMTIAGSFTKSGSPTFNHNSGTITFDGTTGANSSIDASGITFNTVTINRTANSASITLTIFNGTALPLGTVLLLNNGSGYATYNLINDGAITVSAASWSTSVNGTFTNNGSITAASLTFWDMNGNFTNSGTGTVTMPSCTSFDFDFYADRACAGTLTNSSGAVFTTAANPSFSISGSLIVSATSTFPTSNVSLTLDGSYQGNTSVDAPSITFADPVTINRTTGYDDNNITLTIPSGTTLPLGTVALNNTGSSYAAYNLINNYIVTVSAASWSTSVNGTFTNNGSITAASLTFWDMNGNFTNSGTGTVTMPSCTSFDFDIYADRIGAGTLTNSSGAVFTTAANPSFSISGSLIVSATSTFPTSNVSLTLDGSYQGNTSVDAPSITFADPVTINRTVNYADTNITLTIPSGTTLPLGTVYLRNTGSSWATYNLTTNYPITVSAVSWTVTVDGIFTNNSTITANDLTSWTIGGHFTNSGTGTVTMPNCATFDFNSWEAVSPGSLTNSSGAVFTSGSSPVFNVFGHVTLSATSTFPISSFILDGTGTQNFTSGTKSLYNFTVNKSAGIAELIDALDVDNDLTITLGTLDANGFAITVGENWSRTGTFTHGNNTVTFNDASKTTLISGSTTFYNLSCTTPDKVIRFTAGTTQTVTSLTLTGAASHLITIDNESGSSTFALSDTTGTNSVNYVSIAHSAAAGGATWLAYTKNGNVDNGSNSGWVFTAVVYASTSGGTRNWSDDTGTWVTTSGGSTIADHPVAGDTAILDVNSGSVTVDVDSACTTLTMTGYASTLALGTNDLIVSGNLSVVGTVTIGASASTGLSVASMTIGSGGTITCSGNSKIAVSGDWNSTSGTFNYSTSTVTFNGTGTQNITSGTKSFYNFTVNGTSNTVTLLDNASVTGNLIVSKGTLAIATYNLTVTGNSTVTGSGGTATVNIGGSSSTGWTTTDLTIGASGVVTCSGNSKINIAGSSDISAGTFTKDTSTVTFTAISSGKTVKSGSNTYYDVTWDGSGGEWTLQDDMTISNSLVYTIGTLNLNGHTLTKTNLYESITLGSGATINIGSGTFYTYQAESIIVATGGTVTMSTGSMTISSLTVSGTGTFTNTEASSINVIDNISISSSNWTPGTSTVYHKTWSAGHTLYSTQPFYNLSIGHLYGGTTTLQSDITVQNNLTIPGGDTLNASSYTINIGGNFTNSGIFTAGTSTVNFNDAAKTSIISGNTTFNILTSTTPDKAIKFTASSTQTIASLSLTGTSGHLITIDTDTGAGTFNLSDTTGTNQVYYTSITRSAASGGASWLAYTSDGNFDGGSNSGWDFTSGPATYYWVGGVGNWSNGINWSLTSGGSGGSYAPTSIDSVVFDANSGAGTSTVDSGFAGSITDFTTSSFAGSVTLAKDLTVSGNFLHAMGTVNIGTYNLTVTGNSTVTGSGGTATVNIGGSSSTGWTTTDLTIGASGVVTCSGNSKINIAGSSDISAGTFTKDTSTVTFTAISSGKTVKSGSNTYYDVTWDGSGGEWTLQDNLSQNHNIFFTAGTLNLDGHTYTKTASAQSVTMSSGFTLNIASGTLALTVWANLSCGNGTTVAITNGTLTVRRLSISGTSLFSAGSGNIDVYENLSISSSSWNADTSTVTFKSTADQTITSNGNSFYNLTLANTGTSGNDDIILADALDVDNNLIITDGDLNGSNYAITIGKNWDNSGSGSYTAGNETVTFNDASKTSVISGSTTFYNFVCSTPSKRIDFTNGTTQTVSHTLTLNGGAVGTRLDLNSTSPGSYWYINAPVSSTANYVNVQDSNSTNEIITTGSYDSGHNVNWTFSDMYLVITGSSTQTAGDSQTITITAYAGGGVAHSYSGDKSLTFSGANPSPSSDHPTCSNKDSDDINFSDPTVVTFVSGVGQSTMKLYKTEAAEIETTDGTYNTFDSEDYDLNVTVSGASLNDFLVELPDNTTVDVPFSAAISARDIYQNQTTDLTGATSLSVDLGSLLPVSLAKSEFTDDGYWTGDLTISDITEHPLVFVTAINGLANGSDDTTVSGVPASPTIGTPEALTSDSIRWNFSDNSSYEIGFRLYDNLNNLIVSVSTPDLTYLDETGLDVNTQYTGRYVKAFNAQGNSAASSAAADIYTLANLPAGLSGTSGDQQINVVWTANGNPSGTEYYVENTTAATNSGWLTALTWNSGGLSCGTSYSFRVKARNGDNLDTLFTSPIIVNTNDCSSGGGGGGIIYQPPTPPEGGFRISINNGAGYTNNSNVKLQLFGGPDTVRMAISNDSDFTGAIQETYQSTKSWMLTSADGTKTIYAKFYNEPGLSSETVSAKIFVDTTAPEIKITQIKDAYSTVEEVVLMAQTEAGADVVLHWDKKYGLIAADQYGNLGINLGKLSVGKHQLEMTATDLAGNKGKTLIVALTVKPASEMPEVTPKEPGKSIIEKVKELIPEFLKPGEEKKPEQEMIVIPEETPLAFEVSRELSVTYTVSNKPMKDFTQAPLPKEIKKLVEKFPELGKTLAKVGISRLSDLEKLQSVKLSLPGLTTRLGLSPKLTLPGSFEEKKLPGAEITPGKLALPKGIPLANLTPALKQKIPSEIVFARTGGGLIDYNINLYINDKGQPQQQINTISGSSLRLVIKPDQLVKSIKGYVVFKSKNTSMELPTDTNLKADTMKLTGSLADLTNSIFFAKPAFAQPISDFAKNLSKLAQLTAPTKVEQRLVFLTFEYTDPDGDGVYTADIKAPVVEGEYEIITVFDYQDPSLGNKEIRLITVVDPEGYVYSKVGNQELRIKDAIVSLYWLNREIKQYELWPAKEYQQENPQITDVTGKYSFLVPEGTYSLKVEAPGFLSFESETFEVKEGSGIHKNIELRNLYWWMKIFDWKTILFVLVIILLLYNFYRDKIREKRLRNQ